MPKFLKNSSGKDQKSIFKLTLILRPSKYSFLNFARLDNGGAKRDRTADLLRARQALSQLSYGPLSNLSFSLTAALRLSLIQSHTDVCSFIRSGARLALNKKSVVILFKRHLKATFKRYLQTPNN